MKFDNLRSIGNNVGNSLASGCSLMIGVYNTDVFAEARASPGGVIDIDFLTGTVLAGTPSRAFSDATALYPDAVESLCQRHQLPESAFWQLTARYWSKLLERRYLVTVMNRDGRLAIDHYDALYPDRSRKRRMQQR